MNHDRENVNELKLFYSKLRNEFYKNTIIFPGHGDPTDLETELSFNYKINKLSDL